MHSHFVYDIFSYTYTISRVFLFFFYLLLRPPISTLFPYTTLFRSHNIEEYVERFSSCGWEVVAIDGHNFEEINRAFSLATKKDWKSTRLNSSHVSISYAVFCLKKKKKNTDKNITANL